MTGGGERSVTDLVFCLSMDVYSTFKEKIIWPLL